jgi:hypothetical protein
LLGRLHLGNHVLEEQEAAVVNPGQTSTEAAGEPLAVVLVADDPLNLLPLHPERRIGEQVVECQAREPIL